MKSNGLTRMGSFRPWVKRMMPTVYDDSLTYYELLTKVIGYLNQLIDQGNGIIDWVEYLQEVYKDDFSKFRTDFEHALNDFRNEIDENKKDIDSEMTQLRNQFADVERWLRNEALPESVAEELNNWFDSGKLAEIINNEVFDMKADINYVDSEIERIDGAIGKNKEDLADIVVIPRNRLSTEMYDNVRIQEAIDNEKSTQVALTENMYVLDPHNEILLKDNKILKAFSGSVMMFSNERRTKPIIKVVGSNSKIIGVELDLKEFDEESTLTPVPAIGVNDSIENLTVDNVTIKNGYAGVWLNPTINSQIKDVKIINSHLSKLRHHIYLGRNNLNTDNRFDQVENILINNNYIVDGLHDGDGIKTNQNCENLIVTNNFISNHERDALDLYTSGNKVIVSNNIMTKNQKAIDIKEHIIPDYPHELYGYNKDMIISNNLMEENLHGVQVGFGGLYSVNIYGNTIRKNEIYGVYVSGKNINVNNNIVVENCLDETLSTPAGIYVQERNNETPSENIIITNNNIFNNGSTQSNTSGIRCSSRLRNSIINNNIVSNIEDYNNPNQKIGVTLGSNCENVDFKGNKVNGHIKDLNVAINSDVKGETKTINIGNLTIDEINRHYMFKEKNDIALLKARIIVGENIPVNTSNYVNFMLVEGENTPFNVVDIVSTNSVGIDSWKPIDLTVFNSISDLETNNNLVSENELYGFRISSGGEGQPLKDVTVELHYLDY